MWGSRLLRREDGIALVLALVVLLFLSGAAATAMTLADSSTTTAATSNAGQTAYELAEAGVNDAEAVLQASSNTATDPTLLQTPQTVHFSSGSVSYSGSYNSTSSIWTITSTGTVSSPVGGATATTRTLTATAQVESGAGTFNATIWNYAISTGTTNSTTCDMVLQGSEQFQEPLWIQGNLCIEGSAKVIIDQDPVNLSVGGKLIVTASSGQVGTSGTPLNQIHVGGGCGTDVTQATSTCSATGPPKVFGTVLDSNFPSITLPTADYAGAYQAAIPGPMHPCTTTSGTPPVWDNDGSLDLTNYPNGSEYPASSPVDLTPNSAYTCTAVNGSGQTVGLTWNPSTKVLTVNGEMYIDGSATMSNSATYTGSGTIYLSGSFSMTSSVHICASIGCNFALWNSNTTMLLIVAHGDDGSGNSVHIGGSTQYQGGFFASKEALFDGSAHFDGPVVGQPLGIGGSVKILPLPPVTTMPVGVPTTPNTHATAQPPVYTSG